MARFPFPVETPRWGVSNDSAKETIHRNVPTPGVKSETFRRNVSTLKPNSLGSIIGQLKAACTRRISAAGFHNFAWQPRFFDRVIRNRVELEKVRDYIRHNPLMWDKNGADMENIFL